jgi:aspartyl/asparaginyl beta-hydroxylase (cupin superfamily)
VIARTWDGLRRGINDRLWHLAANIPGIERMSSLGEQRFFSNADFPWSAAVEQQYPRIRAEMDVILQERETIPPFQKISTDQAWLTSDDRWRTFFLHAYGHRVEENCRRCPATAAAVQSIPGMTTAFFSILAAGKRLAPHHGPYKGVLRYHLALKVPDPQRCGIIVGGEQRHWDQGRSLIFDDCFLHEAWNDTDEDRVVLFVDFERPLRWPFAQINRGIIWAIRNSPFVQEGVDNLDRWQKQHSKT